MMEQIRKLEKLAGVDPMPEQELRGWDLGEIAMYERYLHEEIHDGLSYGQKQAACELAGCYE